MPKVRKASSSKPTADTAVPTHTPVRQIDIARLAGVTRSTVSRILSDKSGTFSVTPEVRARVLKAISDLGYRPNFMAHALRKNRAGLIGWLGSMSPVRFSAEVLNAAARNFSTEDFLIAPSFTVRNIQNQDLPWFRFDAAMLCGNRTESALATLEASKIPYVSVNCPVGPHGASVAFDDFGGMKLALQHLLELGHRRIAFTMFCDTFKLPHPSVKLRISAYRKILRKAGVEPLPLFLLNENDDEVAAKLLADRVTAVIAYCEVSGLQMLSALQRQGAAVPTDISLLCFNEDELITKLNPPLSCIRLDGELAGLTASNMLLKWLEPPQTRPASVLIPEQLVLRSSTAAPQKGRV